MDNNNLVKPREMLTRARKAFAANITHDVAFRKKQLRALDSMLRENRDLVVDALKKDLRKAKFESVLFEIDFLHNEIKCMLSNLDKWTKPQPVGKTMMTLFDGTYIKYEPYGVVFIIGAWNYPVLLSLDPLIGAIAAGNCAILKPSELTPATATVLCELLPRYLNKDCYHAMLGGAEITTEALKEKFDYIFYTGGCRVGQIVYEAAAKHLTPVTLEMGGKCPVYIDESVADMMPAVRRLIWGKSINAGQTCVAPDYIICTKQVQEKLIEKIPLIVKEFFGENPQKSESLARIVNDNHFRRLAKLIEANKSKVVYGGEYDSNDLYIELTLMANVSKDDPIMQEEIFGPILPILTVQDHQAAIDFINSRSKPLSLYVFSDKKSVIETFLHKTSSGGFVVNDIGLHLSVDTLPFGGVGESGIGGYHGEYSFQTFSHRKAVLMRGYSGALEMLGSVRYPPYTDKNMAILEFLLKKRNLFPDGLQYVAIFVTGMLTLMLVQMFTKSF